MSGRTGTGWPTTRTPAPIDPREAARRERRRQYAARLCWKLWATGPLVFLLLLTFVWASVQQGAAPINPFFVRAVFPPRDVLVTTAAILIHLVWIPVAWRKLEGEPYQAPHPVGVYFLRLYCMSAAALCGVAFVGLVLPISEDMLLVFLVACAVLLAFLTAVGLPLVAGLSEFNRRWERVRDDDPEDPA